MTTFNDIIDMFEDLNAADLEQWIVSGWIKPDAPDSEYYFSQTDIARIRLIAECHYELNIELDSMDVMLSLLDQIYGLRRELHALVKAVHAQPSDVRKSIAHATTQSIDDIDL